MRKEIIDYVENYILPEYEKNEETHNIEHAKKTIKKSIKLAEKYDANKEIAYIVAAFHDCKFHVDEERHEILASIKVLLDPTLKKLYSEKEIRKIAEAIEDHRTQRSRQPRNIYGKIIQTAEKDIDLDEYLLQTINTIKNKNNRKKQKKILELAYKTAKLKYGTNSIAIDKCYLENKEHQLFLDQIQNLLKRKIIFIKYVEELLKGQF